jgi:predicted outer membrane repeat protein
MSNRIESLALVVLGVPVMAIALPTATASADTICVCWDGSGDYLTIQEGIDAAQDGDEVVVCDGTYTGSGNKDLDFHGKTITVRSAGGDPDLCIIDCEGSDSDPHRGFHLHSGESAVVDGFTITNGYTDGSGGGVYCEDAQVTITNCTISSNQAAGYRAGGGVYCHGGQLTISDSTISSNQAVEVYGGGVCCDEGSLTITDCTISGNWAEASGGGVYGEDAQVTITNCTINSNDAGSGGGFGCFGFGMQITITNCTISDNEATGYGGGGIDCYYAMLAPTTISNCTITGNSTAGVGGGVYCNFAETTLTNCTISGNQAGAGGGVSCGSSAITNCTIGDNEASYGGGVYCRSGAAAVTNCTISGNSAEAGGGVYCDSDPTISDCTISDNEASYGGGVYCDSGSPTITNCTIADNAANEGNGGGINFGFILENPLVTNCLITGNTTTGSGGGLCCDVLVPLGGFAQTNCTFAHNAAAEYGGAVYCNSESMTMDLSLTNCILWADLAADGVEIALMDSVVLATAFSDVQGGEAQVYVDEGAELIWGEHNIDADPLFVDPDGPDDDPNTWEDNDFHLSAGSPCIDAGCNWAVPPDTADLDDDGDTTEYTPLDLDGEGRFFDEPNTDDTGCGCPPVVDMGAYEFGGTGPQPCPGDLDCDRMVGQSDLGILLAAWGHTDTCDLDCDGDIDQSDLGILLAHWGEECP